MSSSRPELLVDWCSYKAAKYAVMHWHYSRTMPAGRLAKLGVWEGGRFIGVVVFGHGATPEIGKMFGLTQFEVVELVRVALADHECPTSRAIGVAVRKVKTHSPALRLLVSFADGQQGHIGVVYQAANWIYTGATQYHAYQVLGKVEHPRTLYSRYGVGGQSIPWLRTHIDPGAERITTPGKHRYFVSP